MMLNFSLVKFLPCVCVCAFALLSAEFPALVVKASGLAAGKGVVVANGKDEACQAAVDMLQVHNYSLSPSPF